MARSPTGSWYVQLMRDKIDVSAFRDQLVFGRRFAEADGALAAASDIAAMADSDQVCDCNGVSKGKIYEAIKAKGLATLDTVRTYTKASSSCGSCTPIVEAILAQLGGKIVHIDDPPMCKCTEHGHDFVRRAIVAQALNTIAEVRPALGWKTADGCQKCRPALNYYLLCAWPESYRDHPQSRFVNERVHANIQKDGTYSVVPRMWGGLTNPRELRAIAIATLAGLMVRIRPPPADSPSLVRFLFPVSKNRQCPRRARARRGGTAGRDAQGSSTSRQLPVISPSGPIPVPQCRLGGSRPWLPLVRQAKSG